MLVEAPASQRSLSGNFFKQMPVFHSTLIFSKYFKVPDISNRRGYTVGKMGREKKWVRD